MPAFSLYPFNIIFVFGLGYFFITIEHYTRVNKACVALLMAVFCWVFLFAHQPVAEEANLLEFCGHLANTAQVVLFLLGALTIVEIINSHKAFGIIADFIRIRSKKKMFWLIGITTFFLSSLLDNLTTTIVMVTLLKKWFEEGEDRVVIASGIVIAANAGGAWTPIGDVTTTMLWIGGQVTTPAVITGLFLPSISCMIASFLFLSLFIQGEVPLQSVHKERIEPLGYFVFFLGLSCLIFVPIFKVLTGLPPFMAILMGLGLMWLITDIAHREFDEREHLRVPYVISKVDLTSAFFFLGILLTVDALSDAKVLTFFANWLDATFPSKNVVPVVIGLASSVIDNVPLVAASMKMYSLSLYGTDDSFWLLVAFCAGTGGSIFLIGSAAGVALMGLEKISFVDYLKKGGIAATIGFFVGIAVFFLV